jgi:hypothetical protein
MAHRTAIRQEIVPNETPVRFDGRREWTGMRIAS